MIVVEVDIIHRYRTASGSDRPCGFLSDPLYNRPVATTTPSGLPAWGPRTARGSVTTNTKHKVLLFYGITRTGSCAAAGATAPSKLLIMLLPVDSGTSTISLGRSKTSSASLRAISFRLTYNSDCAAEPAACRTICTRSVLESRKGPPAIAIARETVIGSLSGSAFGV